MNTNRILYPDGHRRSARDYVAMLPNGQYRCSDLTLSDEEILAHYTRRWNIEVMFKQQ